MSIRLSANGGTPIAYQSVSIQVEGNDADDANETAKEKEPAGLLPRNWEPHRIISRSSGRPTISRTCLLYTSPSPRDRQKSRMPSSA